VARDKGINNEDEEWERFDLDGYRSSWQFIWGFKESNLYIEIFIAFGYGFNFNTDKWNKFKSKKIGLAIGSDKFSRGFLEDLEANDIESCILG
jgi:hypothetical protein